MELCDYIKKENICFISKKDKYHVIEELVAKATNAFNMRDPLLFKQSIEAREALLSTGVGVGVAIPHAKIDGVDDFFIVLGVVDAPVDWDSLDQKPVSIVFLIGGPNNQQDRYLKILSKIMMLVKNTDKRSKLMSFKTVEEIYNVISL